MRDTNMTYGNSRVVKVVPEITLPAYEAGDVIGGLQTLDGLGSVHGRGVLKNVSISDAANQKAVLTLLFFSDLPTGPFTDAAAPTWAAGDLAKFIGKVDIAASDYTTVNGKAFCTKECSLVLKGDATRKLYMVIVATATPDYAAATDLTFALGFLLD